jgi:hypothetical protein
MSARGKSRSKSKGNLTPTNLTPIKSMNVFLREAEKKRIKIANDVSDFLLLKCSFSPGHFAEIFGPPDRSKRLHRLDPVKQEREGAFTPSQKS